MSKKLPALHFYTGDWWKDPGIMALSCEERGLWFQMLLIMFESTRRGYLEINGKPFPEKELVKICEISRHKLKKIFQKLIEYGIVSVEKDTNILYSRRMITDERKRQTFENNGKSGGRPSNTKETKKKKLGSAKDNQNPEDEDEYEDVLKGLKDDELINQDRAFELSWSYYPERLGKKAAKRSFKATVTTKADWLRHVHAFNAYVKHVEGKRRKGQKLDWQNGSTWFNNWEDWAKKAEGVE